MESPFKLSFVESRYLIYRFINLYINSIVYTTCDIVYINLYTTHSQWGCQSPKAFFFFFFNLGKTYITKVINLTTFKGTVGCGISTFTLLYKDCHPLSLCLLRTVSFMKQL